MALVEFKNADDPTKQFFINPDKVTLVTHVRSIDSLETEIVITPNFGCRVVGNFRDVAGKLQGIRSNAELQLTGDGG